MAARKWRSSRRKVSLSISLRMACPPLKACRRANSPNKPVPIDVRYKRYRKDLSPCPLMIQRTFALRKVNCLGLPYEDLATCRHCSDPKYICRTADTHGTRSVYKGHGQVQSTARNLFQGLSETNPLREQLRQCGEASLFLLLSVD